MEVLNNTTGDLHDLTLSWKGEREVNTFSFVVKNAFSEFTQLDNSARTIRKSFFAGTALGVSDPWTFTLAKHPVHFGVVDGQLRLSRNSLETSDLKLYEKHRITYSSGDNIIFSSENVQLRFDPFESLKTQVVSIPLKKIVENLKNDEVKVEIQVVLFKGKVSEVIGKETEETLAKRQKNLGQDFGRFLQSKVGSDIVIKIPSMDGFHLQEVHSQILAARSKVFAAMLLLGTNNLEKMKKEIFINDMSKDVLELVLKFIYTGNIDDGWKNCPGEVLYAADKYELLELKEFCDENLHRAVTPQNAEELLTKSVLHKLPRAVLKIATFISENADVVWKINKA